MMRKIAAMLLALIVAFGVTACTSGSSGMTPNDYEVYSKGRKIRVEWRETTYDKSVNFSALDDLKDTCTTNRGIKIGDSVEELIRKYDNCPVAIIDYNKEENRRKISDSFSEYLKDEPVPEKGEISFTQWFVGGKTVPAEDALKAYEEDPALDVFLCDLYFEADDSVVTSIWIAKFEAEVIFG